MSRWYDDDLGIPDPQDEQDSGTDFDEIESRVGEDITTEDRDAIDEALKSDDEWTRKRAKRISDHQDEYDRGDYDPNKSAEPG